MVSLNAIIVDDEALSRNLLQVMLKDHCPGVRVLGEAENIDDTRKLILQTAPDVVFLDVEMPHSNGFDLFTNREEAYRFQTVFVTAYSQYALKALKIGATEYLLKPVDIDELKDTVQKLREWKLKYLSAASQLQMDEPEKKLKLPHNHGFKVVNVRDIIRLKADNNYTEIFLKNEPVVLVSKPIKDFEFRLDPQWFFRVHKSQIINLRYFKEYVSKDGAACARMADGALVPISRLRINDFLLHINEMAFGI